MVGFVPLTSFSCILLLNVRQTLKNGHVVCHRPPGSGSGGSMVIFQICADIIGLILDNLYNHDGKNSFTRWRALKQDLVTFSNVHGAKTYWMLFHSICFSLKSIWSYEPSCSEMNIQWDYGQMALDQVALNQLVWTKWRHPDSDESNLFQLWFIGLLSYCWIICVSMYWILIPALVFKIRDVLFACMSISYYPAFFLSPLPSLLSLSFLFWARL